MSPVRPVVKVLRRVALLGLATVAACDGGRQGAQVTRYAPILAAGVQQPPDAESRPLQDAPAALRLSQARRYVLALVNRDRATKDLRPVELDEGPAQRAAQRHAEDMAHRGFLGHWGSDGSFPESRHTEAGGADMVLENALCFTDEQTRALDPDPRIDAKTLEKFESMFFDELPPMDGHRKNILKPHHRRVGIGIAQPLPRPGELPIPCVTQEFVDAYGTYAEVPRRAKVGDEVRVEGLVHLPAAIAAVGVARVDAPRPIPVAEANKRRKYPVPKPYDLFWPRGYKTRIPLQVEGERFRVDVPLSDHGKPGMYELTIWAKLPGSDDNVIVGVRTVDVRDASSR